MPQTQTQTQTKLVFVSPLYTVMCRYICGSPPTDCTRPPHKRDGHTAWSAFFSQRNSTRSCPCFSVPRCKQRSTVPQGYTVTGVPPSQPPLLGGCGASRRERFALPWYPALRVLPGCVPVFLHGRRPLAGWSSPAVHADGCCREPARIRVGPPGHHVCGHVAFSGATASLTVTADGSRSLRLLFLPTVR